VVDVIRGLQYTEHNNNLPDQMVRNNIILAGEETVAMDAVVAMLLGFNPADIDHLHMGAARGLGPLDLRQIDIVGDELDRFARPWIKPRDWYARCNRDWLLTSDVQSNVATWKRYTSFGDILRPAVALGGPAPVFAAAAKLRAEGGRKGLLWLGLSGRAKVTLNGQKIMEEESVTRFRVGQFQQPVELRPGENQIVTQLQPVGEKPPEVAVVLMGPANNGDSLEGVRWFG
jgi:hypothetical protein